MMRRVSTSQLPEGFRDRMHAGRLLAQQLTGYAKRPDVLVLALPRGGVPVAFEVAMALGATLDILLVRKLPTPGQPELALGAIASGGVRVINRPLVRSLGISDAEVEGIITEQTAELARRERVYRDGRPAPRIQGRPVILVDDGIATGATIQAALRAIQAQRPELLIVAVPVAPPEACRRLLAESDGVVCLLQPPVMQAVGEWYEQFLPVSDEEVIRLLQQADQRRAPQLSGQER